MSFTFRFRASIRGAVAVTNMQHQLQPPRSELQGEYDVHAMQASGAIQAEDSCDITSTSFASDECHVADYWGHSCNGSMADATLATSRVPSMLCQSSETQLAMTAALSQWDMISVATGGEPTLCLATLLDMDADTWDDTAAGVMMSGGNTPDSSNWLYLAERTGAAPLYVIAPDATDDQPTDSDEDDEDYVSISTCKVTLLHAGHDAGYAAANDLPYTSCASLQSCHDEVSAVLPLGCETDAASREFEQPTSNTSCVQHAEHIQEDWQHNDGQISHVDSQPECGPCLISSTGTSPSTQQHQEQPQDVSWHVAERFVVFPHDQQEQGNLNHQQQPIHDDHDFNTWDVSRSRGAQGSPSSAAATTECRVTPLQHLHLSTASRHASQIQDAIQQHATSYHKKTNGLAEDGVSSVHAGVTAVPASAREQEQQQCEQGDREVMSSLDVHMSSPPQAQHFAGVDATSYTQSAAVLHQPSHPVEEHSVQYSAVSGRQTAAASGWQQAQQQNAYNNANSSLTTAGAISGFIDTVHSQQFPHSSPQNDVVVSGALKKHDRLHTPNRHTVHSTASNNDMPTPDIQRRFSRLCSIDEGRSDEFGDGDCDPTSWLLATRDTSMTLSPLDSAVGNPHSQQAHHEVLPGHMYDISPMPLPRRRSSDSSRQHSGHVRVLSHQTSLDWPATQHALHSDGSLVLVGQWTSSPHEGEATEQLLMELEADQPHAVRSWVGYTTYQPVDGGLQGCDDQQVQHEHSNESSDGNQGELRVALNKHFWLRLVQLNAPSRRMPTAAEANLP